MAGLAGFGGMHSDADLLFFFGILKCFCFMFVDFALQTSSLFKTTSFVVSAFEAFEELVHQKTLPWKTFRPVRSSGGELGGLEVF